MIMIEGQLHTCKREAWRLEGGTQGRLRIQRAWQQCLTCGVNSWILATHCLQNSPSHSLSGWSPCDTDGRMESALGWQYKEDSLSP